MAHEEDSKQQPTGHKWLDEIHLTKDGGVIKRIYNQGEADSKTPEKGQEVTVHYEGRLEDGSIFDESSDRGEALKFYAGTGQVIKGWDIGIMTMKLGEKAELIIKSDYGYGKIGNPPKIPGDATLIFTLELIQIADRKPTRWMMSDPELIQVALRMKEDGNLRFKAAKWKEAEGMYREALVHLETVKNDNDKLKELKKTVLVNIAVVSNKSGDYKEALINCTKALDLDEKNPKPYYLRAQANTKLHQYDEAIQDIKQAIKLNPNDKNLRDEFDKIKEQKKKSNIDQSKAARAFFSEGMYNEKKAVLTNKEGQVPDFDATNPQVFMDIEIGNASEPETHHKGRVVFELFKKKVPKTVENFRSLCTKDDKLHYRGNIFHRILEGFMMQGGDITNMNGTGGKSIYGPTFNDEKMWLPHSHSGLLSMANSGPNTNNSQFFITFAAAPWLNMKHTVFGRVLTGMDICRKAELVKTGAQDKPLIPVKIRDCGELIEHEKLNKEQCDYLENYEKKEEEVPEDKRVEI